MIDNRLYRLCSGSGHGLQEIFSSHSLIRSFHTGLEEKGDPLPDDIETLIFV
jgi:hypothetical protein